MDSGTRRQAALGNPEGGEAEFSPSSFFRRNEQMRGHEGELPWQVKRKHGMLLSKPMRVGRRCPFTDEETEAKEFTK